jgi:hypothetical protein
MTQQETMWGRVEGWLAFLGFLCLFLIGPAVPQLLDRFHGTADLRAITDGPVYFSDHAAYALEIQNNGSETERNVEVSVRVPERGDVHLEAGVYEYQPRFLRARQLGDQRVLNIGDLRPGERYTLAVSATWRPVEDTANRYAGIPWILPRVASEARSATQDSWKFTAYREQSRTRWYHGALNLLSAALVLLMLLLAREAREFA